MPQRFPIWIGIFSIAAMVTVAGHSLAQPSNPINTLNSTPPPAGQYIGTITDPTTGKQFDRYLEQETVPVPRWEQQEVSERRWIPQWVNETQKVTETRYVPYVEYQPQQRALTQWNPLVQPQLVWQYVPVTRYQAINQIVERPMTYQKYVEQEVKVVVPKLVQATEARGKYVDRERSPTASSQAATSNPIQNAADIAMANRNVQVPRYTTRPMDGWYSGSQTPSALYPYSPYASLVAPPAAPFNGNLYANNPNLPTSGSSPYVPAPSNPYPQGQLVSNQTVTQPVANAYPYGNPWTQPSTNAYAANPSFFQWPSWTNTNVPLFQQDFFSQNRSAPYGSQSSGGMNYPTIATQNAVTGTLRPSTAPLMPATPAGWGTSGSGAEAYRDPTQSGIAPTVLR